MVKKEQKKSKNAIDLSKRSNLKKALIGGAAVGAGVIGLSGLANADIIFRRGGTETSLTELAAGATGAFSKSTGGEQSAKQGSNALASGAFGALAQGLSVTAAGNYGSFAQGYDVIASGSNGSFAQGSVATASGIGGSFAQGTSVLASGNYGSFAQGLSATASGENSWQIGTGVNTEGTSLKIANGIRIFGSLTGPGSPRNGDLWVNTSGTVLAYSKSSTYDIASLAEGSGAFTADGSYAAYQGTDIDAGNGSIIGAFAQGSFATASASLGSFAQGYNVTASGTLGSFAQGQYATASGTRGSFAQGYSVYALGSDGSFAQGSATVASGYFGSFAQGYGVTALGNSGSFAQGGNTTASGVVGSFAQGSFTVASGQDGSFAQGYNATASGNYGSFAQGLSATASGENSWQIGTGVNTEGTSLKIAEGIRIFGNMSGPETPRAGDIYVNSGGTVLVYSQGTWKTI